MNRKQKRMLCRIIVAAAILVGLQFLPVRPAWCFVLYLVPYFIVGYDIVIKTFHGIRNRRPFDENLLMTVATAGAFVIAVYEDFTGGTGDYNEAIAVMLFYQVGELFQSYAVGRSRRNITELMNIRPDYANVQTDGKIEKVDPQDLPPGSEIVVMPGEKVPIDGIVIDGESSLNTSALTGESIPRDIVEGDEIISGCINMSGVLKIRTTKEFGESTVSKILELMEDASSRKSRSEAFITKFARIYTPVVVYAAIALAILPSLITIAAGATPAWDMWIYRALSFLVISCPCALVISIPLSFFAGLGGAGNAGILVKGSNYMEMLSQTKYVAFDKTGTLTRGVFEVKGVHEAALKKKELVEIAALAESASSHPISRSLKMACDSKPDISRVKDIREISGHGVVAIVDGRNVACGNARLMDKLGVEYKACDDVGTIVHVAVDGVYAGHIIIADVEKPEAAEAIKGLKESGIEKTIMLTGDLENVANKVAADLGIDEVHAGLLPADKVSVIEGILERKDRKGRLAFVGDGINDAPVLARADIGIAMGAMGADAAIEAADVVLMDDDPRKISKAIRISRKCLRIVYENITFAIGIKVVFLILGAFGVVGMWMAVFADVGVMIIAVLNAIRALFVKNL